MCLLGSWPLVPQWPGRAVVVPPAQAPRLGGMARSQLRLLGRAMGPGPLWLTAVIGLGIAGGALAL